MLCLNASAARILAHQGKIVYQRRFEQRYFTINYFIARCFFFRQRGRFLALKIEKNGCGVDKVSFLSKFPFVNLSVLSLVTSRKTPRNMAEIFFFSLLACLRLRICFFKIVFMNLLIAKKPCFLGSRKVLLEERLGVRFQLTLRFSFIYKLYNFFRIKRSLIL